MARLLQIREHTSADGDGKNFDVRLRAAKAKVKDLEDKFGDLWDAKVNGDLPPSVWKPRNERLKDALTLARAEVSRIEGERADYERKRVSEQSLEARIEKVLAECVRSEPKLESEARGARQPARRRARHH